MPDDVSLITDEMRALVGVEGPPMTLEIDRGTIRTITRATGATNPIYYDVEAARAAGHPDLPAPPGFLGRFVFQPGKSDPTFSSPVTGAEFPIDLPNQLHGATGIRTYRRLFAGERLTATEKTTDVGEREGRMGRMLIVQSVLTYRDEAGTVVAEKYDTGIFYR